MKLLTGRESVTGFALLNPGESSQPHSLKTALGSRFFSDWDELSTSKKNTNKRARRCKSNRFRTSLCVLIGVSILLTIFASAVHGQAPQNVGYVLSVQGTWHLERTTNPLQRFETLQARARIVGVKQPTKGAYITIALFNGETIRRACDAKGICGPPITLPNSATPPPSPSVQGGSPASQAETSTKSRIRAAFMSLFEHPERYFVSALARGSKPDLSDAVIESVSGKVNLSSVFKDLPRGSHHLAVEPLSLEGPAVEPAVSDYLDIEWAPDQPAQATTDKLEPGLYRLIGSGTDQSWILVVNSDQYKMASDSFQSAVAETKEWSSEVDAATVRMFLRACLDDLARQVQPPPNKKAMTRPRLWQRTGID